MDCVLATPGKKPIGVNQIAYAIALDLDTMPASDVAKKHGLPISAVYGFGRVIGKNAYGRMTFIERYDLLVKYLLSVEYTSMSALRALATQSTFDELVLLIKKNRPELFSKIKKGRELSKRDARKRVLRLAWENPGMSASELAAYARVSRQFIYNLESEGLLEIRRTRAKDKGSRSPSRTGERESERV